MGAAIAGIAFIGGCLVLKSLMSSSPQIYLLTAGLFLLVVAIVMFIREIRKIG